MYQKRTGFRLLGSKKPHPKMDAQHADLQDTGEFVRHNYGEGVYILNSTFALSAVAELGRLPPGHPGLYEKTEALALVLMQKVVDREFRPVHAKVRTSMADFYPEEDVAYRGKLAPPTVPLCLVEIPRAGTRTTLAAEKVLRLVIDYSTVWLDHHPSQRLVDGKGQAVATARGQQKVSGRPLDNTKMIVFDPMFARGESAVGAVDYYWEQRKEFGFPIEENIIFVGFIGTPESIRTIRKRFPKAKVYFVRLDRGRSSSRVLKSVPGTYPKEEKGLTNDKKSRSYIYPGGGGMGEKLSNCFNAEVCVHVQHDKRAR